MPFATCCVSGWHSPWQWAEERAVHFQFFSRIGDGHRLGLMDYRCGDGLLRHLPAAVLALSQWPRPGGAIFRHPPVAVVFNEFALHLTLPPAAVASNLLQLQLLPAPAVSYLRDAVLARIRSLHRWPRASRRARRRSDFGESLGLSRACCMGSLNFWFPDDYYWQAVIYSALLMGLGILPLGFRQSSDPVCRQDQLFDLPPASLDDPFSDPCVPLDLRHRVPRDGELPDLLRLDTDHCDLPRRDHLSLDRETRDESGQAPDPRLSAGYSPPPPRGNLGPGALEQIRASPAASSRPPAAAWRRRRGRRWRGSWHGR